MTKWNVAFFRAAFEAIPPLVQPPKAFNIREEMGVGMGYVWEEVNRQSTAKESGACGFTGQGKQISNRRCCCSAAEKEGRIQQNKCTK